MRSRESSTARPCDNTSRDNSLNLGVDMFHCDKCSTAEDQRENSLRVDTGASLVCEWWPWLQDDDHVQQFRD